MLKLATLLECSGIVPILCLKDMNELYPVGFSKGMLRSVVSRDQQPNYKVKLAE